MKSRGRKRPADANLLMQQVSAAFEAKKNELGAERAAKQIRVCKASFYKYIAKRNVPDIDVLRRATDEWGIKWKYLDPYEVLRTVKAKSPEQLVFSFLDAMDEDNIEVTDVTPDGKSVLRISLRIRIPV